jgi:hypothetical protein
MTKDFDEYKADKGKHKFFNVFLKVFGVIVIIGCVLAGFMFLLMVAFPMGLWVDLFK